MLIHSGVLPRQLRIQAGAPALLIGVMLMRPLGR
jgi:hypothetical protein